MSGNQDLSFVVEAVFVAPDDAAKGRAIRSGYRPALWFGETDSRGTPHLHSCLVDLIDRDEVLPGEVFRAVVRPFAIETWPRLDAGTTFLVYEGVVSVGSGQITRAVTTSALTASLHEALEEWVVNRFGDQIVRREPRRGRAVPDLVAWFDDERGEQQALVVEVVAHRPRRRDVERLGRMMDDFDSALGVLVTFDEPSAAVWRSIVELGSVGLPGGEQVAKVRWVSVRDLLEDESELLPGEREPARLQLLAA